MSQMMDRFLSHYVTCFSNQQSVFKFEFKQLENINRVKLRLFRQGTLLDDLLNKTWKFYVHTFDSSSRCLYYVRSFFIDNSKIGY